MSQPDGEWLDGEVQLQSYYAGGSKGRQPIDDGVNLQHIYEAGEQFEALLDHPAWFGRVQVRENYSQLPISR
eukprot:SAG31_NODE_8001_length_1544_cov_1.057439_4_plen_72_part_00